MKLKSNVNMLAFLEEVKKCDGEVCFESTEGDILNLKSLLSQYLFAALSRRTDLLSLGGITCTQPNDYEKLMPYLVKQD